MGTHERNSEAVARRAADPYAGGFYRSMGAKRIGEVPSSVFPNRKPSLMEYVLKDGKYKRNEKKNNS